MTSLMQAAFESGQPGSTLPQRAPHILVCTPCHSGKVDINYHIALALAGGHMSKHGVNYTLDYNVGMSIDWARSQMASTFLQMPDCTHLLFIDDDMAFAADLPYRLLCENVDIVAVPYRRKQRDVKYNVRHGVRVKRLPNRPHMIGVESIATGMMMIRRNVFETLAKTTPKFRYTDAGNEGYLFFRHQLTEDEMVGGVSYMGEDYFFCKSARAAGFEIWAYIDEEIAHVGPYAYGGNYRSYAEKDTKDDLHCPDPKLELRMLLK